MNVRWWPNSVNKKVECCGIWFAIHNETIVYTTIIIIGNKSRREGSEGEMGPRL